MADQTTVPETTLTNVVYGIYRQDEPERIRYVGLTSKTARLRLIAHWHKVNEGAVSPLHSFMRKHGKEAVRVRVIEQVPTLEDLNEREIHWIAHFRGLGQADLNILSGGNQAFGHRRTEEQKLKLTLDRRAIYHERFAETVLAIREAVCINGLTYPEVAKLTGVGQQAVGHIMRNESWDHVPWAPGTQPNSKKSPRYSEDTRSELVTRYLAGEPWEEIEAALSVSRSRGQTLISEFIRDSENSEALRVERERRKKSKYEITSRKLQGENARNTELTDDAVAEIKAQLWRGVRPSEIESEYGLSRSVVGGIAREVSWSHVPWPIGPRMKQGTPRGSARAQVKLNDDKVREIRRRGPVEKYADLAAEFGVSSALISHVVNRRVWSHVLD